jgi:hypothetical protein
MWLVAWKPINGESFLQYILCIFYPTQTLFYLSANSWVFESMTNATILQNEWRDSQDPKIDKESEVARAERHEGKSRYHYQVNKQFAKPDGN